MNKEKDVGWDRDGGKFDDEDDDASNNDISDGDDVDTGNGIAFE